MLSAILFFVVGIMILVYYKAKETR